MEKHGNNEWLRQYNFVLCDMTKTVGKTENGISFSTQKYITLRRDNLLRNAGGDFAPVVVISDEQYADSTLALYTKSGSKYSAYCSAGGYSPEAYTENMIRPFYAGSKTAAAIKLYKVVLNTERVLAIELFNAAQALEFRRPLKSSPAIEEIFNEYRKSVPFIINDEVMYPYIKKSIEFLNR